MILKKNRTIILTTAALIPVMVALGACSWLQENPKSGTYNNWQAAETVAPPPQTRVMQTAEGTWLEPDRTPKPVPTATELAELKQANLRIAELEQEIGALRNDMNMMMPALTRLAGLERNASVALNDIQPAAGGVQGGEVPPHQARGSAPQHAYPRIFERGEAATNRPGDAGDLCSAGQSAGYRLD